MKGMIKDFILNSIAAGVLCHRRLRMSIYRLYGAEIPTDCEIKPRCYNRMNMALWNYSL